MDKIEVANDGVDAQGGPEPGTSRDEEHLPETPARPAAPNEKCDLMPQVQTPPPIPPGHEQSAVSSRGFTAYSRAGFSPTGKILRHEHPGHAKSHDGERTADHPGRHRQQTQRPKP